MSEVNSIKQIIITRFEKPINEVQEAFDALISALDEDCMVLYGGSKNKVDNSVHTLRQKISNLKALLPTVQQERNGGGPTCRTKR